MIEPRSVVVCVTGASGAVYARRTLELLAAVRTGSPDAPPRPITTSCVTSPNAALVWEQELGTPMPRDFVEGSRRYDPTDFGAPFASGSNAPDAVIVVPCSMTSLAKVAHGGGGDLIARTCEVALKERRTLVLVVRETPLSLVHLRNMVTATEAGAIVLPAIPSFYAEIRTLEQAVDTVVVRALDRIGLRLPVLRRWGEETDG